jgi:hypothetical protein
MLARLPESLLELKAACEDPLEIMDAYIPGFFRWPLCRSPDGVPRRYRQGERTNIMNDLATRQPTKLGQRNEIMDRAKKAGMNVRTRRGWTNANRVEMDLIEPARAGPPRFPRK